MFIIKFEGRNKQMTGKELSKYREYANLTPKDLSDIFQINIKTLEKMEQRKDEIPLVYTHILRDMFENIILSPSIRKATDKFFSKLPSEGIQIWIYDRTIFPKYYLNERLNKKSDITFVEEQLILPQNTFRIQCLYDKTSCDECKETRKSLCKDGYYHLNDKKHKDLRTVSLTTLPIRNAEILNLNAEEINSSKNKRHRTNKNHNYFDQTCHSILNIPYKLETPKGPILVFMLGFENKLEKRENAYQVIKPTKDSNKIFTYEDVDLIKKLMKEVFEKDLKEILLAFNYLHVTD